MNNWLNYCQKMFVKEKTDHLLYDKFNGKYEFKIYPDARKDIKPIRPLVGKLPMQMIFIDDAGRVFKYDKYAKSYLFQYSSMQMKEITEAWLMKP